MSKKYQEFEKLVNKDAYQVFLMSCPAYFPLSFARHPWFVINKKGVLSRWEVYSLKGALKTSWGHLYLNGFVYSPFQGIKMFPFSKKYSWNPSLISVIEGGQDSLAYRIIEAIESSPEEYTFKEKYVLTGPNSNTYVQWVLNKFPESNIKLSWRYIGKGFIK